MSMSGQTTSEALFEQWCHTQGVDFRRIKVARAKGQKRPDYAVQVSGFWCIVEIKQIDPTVEDNSRLATLRQGNVEGYWVDPGVRLARPIRKASGQLREFSHRGFPTVLCLFDATASFHNAPFQVVQAMIGKETLHFEVSSDPKHDPRFLGTRHGKDATMTKDDNRSISAVAVLLRPTEDSLFIDLYHNPFARVRIPDEVANPLVRKQIMPTLSSPPSPGPSGLEFLIGPDWREWAENPDEKFDQVVREALGEPEP
jgi:hypothetical protein